jgi:hypothetical protein
MIDIRLPAQVVAHALMSVPAATSGQVGSSGMMADEEVRRTSRLIGENHF